MSPLGVERVEALKDVVQRQGVEALQERIFFKKYTISLKNRFFFENGTWIGNSPVLMVEDIRTEPGYFFFQNDKYLDFFMRETKPGSPLLVTSTVTLLWSLSWLVANSSPASVAFPPLSGVTREDRGMCSASAVTVSWSSTEEAARVKEGDISRETTTLKVKGLRRYVGEELWRLIFLRGNIFFHGCYLGHFSEVAWENIFLSLEAEATAAATSTEAAATSTVLHAAAASTKTNNSRNCFNSGSNNTDPFYYLVAPSGFSSLPAATTMSLERTSQST